MVAGEEIFQGDIIIEDGKIISVGANSTSGEYDVEIDCQGNLLMPGFKNAHAHSGMSGLRSLADDLPLNEWLTKSIFPVEARMTADDIYWMSQLSVLEYLTSGITACFDMYMEQDAVAKAMDDMGFRCVQTSGANDFSKDIREMSRYFPIVVGEWCDSFPVDRTARADDTPLARESMIRAAAAAQLYAFEQAYGWFFWSYKLISEPQGWDARKAFLAGWLPDNCGS